MAERVRAADLWVESPALADRCAADAGAFTLHLIFWLYSADSVTSITTCPANRHQPTHAMLKFGLPAVDQVAKLNLSG